MYDSSNHFLNGEFLKEANKLIKPRY